MAPALDVGKAYGNLNLSLQSLNLCDQQRGTEKPT